MSWTRGQPDDSNILLDVCRLCEHLIVITLNIYILALAITFILVTGATLISLQR